MKYVITRASSDELQHHGIKDQKWGVRRFQNYDGSYTPAGRIRYGIKGERDNKNHNELVGIPKNADSRNLSQFGKDADHNVCYIMGISGSGKSTIAKNNANDKTNIIHLDSYFENPKESMNEEFNKFLKSKGFDKDALRSTKSQKNNGEYWKKVDIFGDLIQEFGKDQYSKNKRVICEGFQMMDETLYPDKSFFREKPTIILNTSYVTSALRANKRDGQRLSIEDFKNIRKQKLVVKKLKNEMEKNVDKVFASESLKAKVQTLLNKT